MPLSNIVWRCMTVPRRRVMRGCIIMSESSTIGVCHSRLLEWSSGPADALRTRDPRPLCWVTQRWGEVLPNREACDGPCRSAQPGQTTAILWSSAHGYLKGCEGQCKGVIQVDALVDGGSLLSSGGIWLMGRSRLHPRRASPDRFRQAGFGSHVGQNDV